MKPPVLTRSQWKWVALTVVGAVLGWLVIEYFAKPVVKENIEPAVKDAFT